MAENTSIAWTDATWNPVRGCTRVSEGCRRCYAEGVAARFSNPGAPYHGFADRTRPGSKWTGRVEPVPNKLTLPLSWRQPRMVFVNSMSDLFHESLPDDEIDKIVVVMGLARQHTFQVLTKRAERMRAYVTGLVQESDLATARRVARALNAMNLPTLEHGFQWPLPNVWWGVSVENQAAADERIPHLQAIPAAVRFWSVEPMLGPVSSYLDRIGWVICGGESGHGARPMRREWVISLQLQCAAFGVPFFFKQTGSNRAEWPPGITGKGDDPEQWPPRFRVQRFPQSAMETAR